MRYNDNDDGSYRVGGIRRRVFGRDQTVCVCNQKLINK
jgi:hypothetical protein